jgi:SagB-type dehydrogenase family enzyme
MKHQAGEVIARACPGLAAIACPNGVTVEGGWVRHVFGGNGADLVGAILPRLDGTRSATALAAELGRKPAAVAAVIDHLVHIGAAEPAGPSEPGGAVGPAGSAGGPGYAGRPEAERLIRRIARSGGLVATAAEALARLASARVSVLATPDVGNTLRSALLEAGIGEVRLGWPTEANDQLVIVGEGQPAARLASLDALCARQRCPWLLVTASDDRIQLGPLFDRRYTPCYHCAARSLDPEGVGGDAEASGAGAIAVALAAEIAICFLGGLAPVKSIGAAISLDLSTWSSSVRRLSRRAGCESCSPVTGEAPGDDPLSYWFDQLVEPDPPVIAQQHAAVEMEFTELLNDRKVPPPTPPLVLPDTGRPNRGRVDALTLGWLLRRAAGRPDISPPGSLAPASPGLAPTAGNLRSVFAYVACRDVVDVAAGCYFYDPFAHELRATGTAVAASDALAAEPWTAAVIMTAALSRLRAKYNDFALKLAYLDAGCAMTQLELACAAAGLSCHGCLSVDSAYLASLIGADPETEPVTGLAFVSVRGNPGDG